jgi:hypothetical protein
LICHIYRHIISLLLCKGSAYLISHMYEHIIQLLWCKEAASILPHASVFIGCRSFNCYRKQSNLGFDTKIDAARIKNKRTIKDCHLTNRKNLESHQECKVSPQNKSNRNSQKKKSLFLNHSLNHKVIKDCLNRLTETLTPD